MVVLFADGSWCSPGSLQKCCYATGVTFLLSRLPTHFLLSLFHRCLINSIVVDVYGLMFNLDNSYLAPFSQDETIFVFGKNFDLLGVKYLYIYMLF